MFAQVDIPAEDVIEESEDPQIKVFHFDSEELTEQGIKIIVGGAVVLIYPVREFAYKLLEVTDGFTGGNSKDASRSA